MPDLLTANEKTLIAAKIELLTKVDYGVSCMMYVAAPTLTTALLECGVVQNGSATTSQQRLAIEQWVTDATPGNLSNLSNSDAERRALSEIGKKGNWGHAVNDQWTVLPPSATLYVLGTKGPCKDCKKAVPKIAAQLANLAIKWIYTLDLETNGTIGGQNGFANAIKVQLSDKRAAWVYYSGMFAPFLLLLPNLHLPVAEQAIKNFFNNGVAIPSNACGSSAEAKAVADLLGEEIALSLLRGAWKKEGTGWARA
ncbi:MAG TPA: hypothetical protein VFA65_20020 [Bryobacteraceae bacterium]|nr:hypothetical protein [Bryobacteraceae bacterium]